MKNSVFIIGLILLSASFPGVQAQEREQRNIVATGVGYANPSGLAGFEVGIEYAHLWQEECGILGKVELSEAYATVYENFHENVSNYNNVYLGLRWNFLRRSKFTLGAAIMAGVAFQWSYDAYADKYATGGFSSVWKLDFLTAQQIDAVYHFNECMPLCARATSKQPTPGSEPV